MHVINVVWSPDPDNKGITLGDRYTRIVNSYNIPIAFSPDYERTLE